MKSILFAMAAALSLGGCAATGPATAWGKPGVSKLDYGTDLGMCTGLAAQRGSGSGANTAGGVQGANNQPIMDRQRGSSVNPGSGPTPASNAASSASLPTGGTYSGMASADYAQRAATQQRSQEMLAKRLQAEAFKSCISERGYKEFALTAEQRAQLAKLKAGSNEYHQYLHAISSDPAVVGASAK
jgi:hypothetical protein